MTKTVLKVDGMTCDMCTSNVGKALKEIKGVTNVNVDLKKGTATVEHDESVKDETLIAAVLDAGFRAKVKRGLFG